MEIQYKEIKKLDPNDLQDLFLSVEWSSGHYPDKLALSMQNSDTVLTAWDGNALVGLISVLDDGVMTAYVHFLLVKPSHQGRGIGKQLISRICEKYKDYLRIVLIAYAQEKGFYQSCGFSVGEGKTPMFITSLWT